MRQSRRLFSIAIVIIACAAFHTGGVRAADIEVGIECSLADAIRAANSDAAVGACPAGSGADTISLNDKHCARREPAKQLRI